MIHLSGRALFKEGRLPVTVRQHTILSRTPQLVADCHVLVFVTAGWGILRFALGELALESGYIATIPQGAWCSLAPVGFTDIVVCYVHDDFLKGQLHWLPAAHPLVRLAVTIRDGAQSPGVMKVSQSRMQRLRPLLSNLAALDRGPGDEFTRLAHTANLFHELSVFRSHATGSLQNKPTQHGAVPRDQIAHAACMLRSQLARPWTVAQLAREVTMSESQLTRLFTQELGLSPAAFLWQTRTDRMAELLAGTDLTVSQAASRSGWANASAASRAFKRRYGVSPGSFAESIRHGELVKQP
jgi:AraC-like DNA-binding protein